MSTATLKRELALLRSSLAALKPSQSGTLDDPIPWAERIAALTLDPWQREVLLSAAPRLLLNATRQSGKSAVAALKAARTVWRAASPWWSRRRCGSPASCSASSPAILWHPTPASGARCSPRSNSSQVGWRSACLAIVRPCCAACRCATPAPQCDATERQEHIGGAQGRLDRAAGRSRCRGLAVAAAVRLLIP